MAGRQGHAAAVEVLLVARANIDARVRDGSTALMAAATGGHEAAVQTLIGTAADVNAKDQGGLPARQFMDAKPFSRLP